MTPERRRTFLRLAGSAVLAGLAGCTDDGGAGGGDGDDTERTNAGGADENVTATGDGGATTRGSRDTSESSTATSTRTANGTSDDGRTTTSTADLSGPVPTAYRTATSQGGTERNPDSLQSKGAVEYQSQPKDGQRCSGCLFYIPDKNGDGLGACSVVAGYIEPAAWCASYSPYQND